MAKSREIKRRIKAVGNIRRITKTMQMIATARFQAAQKRATASRPYIEKISELVAELSAAVAAQKAQSAGTPGGQEQAEGEPAGDEAAAGQPSAAQGLLEADRKKSGKQLVLVITSNRGLCGGYNSNVLRTAAAFLREKQAQGVQIDLELVGKKGQAFFKFMNQPVKEFHAQFGDKPAFEAVHALTERYMKEFAAGAYDAVTIIYMAFQSMARQAPRVQQILPVPKPADQAGADAKPAAVVEYDFSPDAQTLLNELLPLSVDTQVFQSFNEAVVSEQIARMVAMKAATDSAGKMGKELSRKYNRARQAAITTELSEIIAGAASLG